MNWPSAIGVGSFNVMRKLGLLALCLFGCSGACGGGGARVAPNPVAATGSAGAAYTFNYGSDWATRVSADFLLGSGLRADDAVELSVVDGALVVKAVKPQAPTLAELLRGVTDDNLPDEWDTGPATGREAW